MTMDPHAKLRKHVYMTKEAWKIADQLRRREGLTLSAFLEQLVRRHKKILRDAAARVALVDEGPVGDEVE